MQPQAALRLLRSELAGRADLFSCSRKALAASVLLHLPLVDAFATGGGAKNASWEQIPLYEPFGACDLLEATFPGAWNVT